MEQVIAWSDHARPCPLHINHIHADDALNRSLPRLQVGWPCQEVLGYLPGEDLAPVVILFGQEALGDEAPWACVGLQQKQCNLQTPLLICEFNIVKWGLWKNCCATDSDTSL